MHNNILSAAVQQGKVVVGTHKQKNNIVERLFLDKCLIPVSGTVLEIRKNSNWSNEV